MAPWRISRQTRTRNVACLGGIARSSLTLSSSARGFLGGLRFLYWTLRHSFRTSRAAALVGSSLLLFSVIRLEETNIIGPHHLMLACTLVIAGLGYQWCERPTVQAARQRAGRPYAAPSQIR